MGVLTSEQGFAAGVEALWIENINNQTRIYLREWSVRKTEPFASGYANS
ncbi:MAG: hypothetical protein ABJL72_08525 [Roseobacter sp.]